MFGTTPQQLRNDLRESNKADIKRRRGIVVISLAGLAGMAAVTLLQTGLIRRLCDLPVEGFDAEKVTLSNDAYQFGAPDAALASASLSANLPLAAFGGEDRARDLPLVPLVSAAKAAADTVVAGWSFYRMIHKEKAWCSYCMLGGMANIGVLALAIPEAIRALRALKGD